MSDLDLAGLRNIAEAAEPGPWSTEIWEHNNGRVLDGEGYPLSGDDGVYGIFAAKDAEHIAAFDPPTCLALLDRIEERGESEVMRVAAQRAERIRELEAERDMARQEYHELEEFHRLYIDPYKGDDGGIEAAKSYLIGRLRELNRSYKQRAKHAEARLDKVRVYVETLSAGPPLGSNWMRWADQAIVRLRSILDGEET